MKSVVTTEPGRRLSSEAQGHDVPLLVVADRIAEEAKRLFRSSGINFFDRRGELRVVDPPLVIDTTVEPAMPVAGSRRGSLDSQVSKEVAITCLLAPNQPHGVREVARFINRAPSAVCDAMAGLRHDGC